ncbi:MAG TPA: radical SAM family heme chaperone HemW [Chitinispirillaceae bacterium]|nr:radical SAM family heme chaperone HemW [Chitinispirillaceae bacterium]
MNTEQYFSLYIHIPFCAAKCSYCDFYSRKGTEDEIRLYCNALLKELDTCRKTYELDNFKVTSVFFGGGTPSILNPDIAEMLCIGIKERVTLIDNAEWTFECNPDSFSTTLAEALYGCGVNRLSFGVQSLHDNELHALGRIHSAQQALDILQSDCISKFSSVNADLMYGIPYQSVNSFLASLQTICSISTIKHISAYELTFCENTPFGKMRLSLQLPDEPIVDTMTSELFAYLHSNGFEHYEISNFAKSGFRCYHNESYWDHSNYIGLGASAHSYFNRTRRANIADIANYCMNINEKGTATDFSEYIDNQKLSSEMIFLGLRRSDGINEHHFKEATGFTLTSGNNRSLLDNYIRSGMLTYIPPFWKPTEKGMLFADGMASSLFHTI